MSAVKTEVSWTRLWNGIRIICKPCPLGLSLPDFRAVTLHTTILGTDHKLAANDNIYD